MTGEHSTDDEPRLPLPVAAVVGLVALAGCAYLWCARKGSPGATCAACAVVLLLWLRHSLYG